MADHMNQFPDLFPGTSVEFDNKWNPFIYYYNGTIPIYLKALGLPEKDNYLCYCIGIDNGSVYVTTPNTLYVNKLDTKAAKLLYLKE